MGFLKKLEKSRWISLTLISLTQENGSTRFAMEMEVSILYDRLSSMRTNQAAAAPPNLFKLFFLFFIKKQP